MSNFPRSTSPPPPSSYPPSTPSSSTGSNSKSIKNQDTTNQLIKDEKTILIIMLIICLITLIIYGLFLYICYRKSWLMFSTDVTNTMNNSFEPLGTITPLSASDQEAIQNLVKSALNDTSSS